MLDQRYPTSTSSYPGWSSVKAEARTPEEVEKLFKMTATFQDLDDPKTAAAPK
jgi:hypothetical protein